MNMNSVVEFHQCAVIQLLCLSVTIFAGVYNSYGYICY